MTEFNEIHWFDIAFLLALFIALPIYSARSFRIYLALAHRGEDLNRSIIYWQTMGMQWTGFTILAAGWLLLDRPLANLGMQPGSAIGYATGGAVALLLVVFFGYQLTQIRKISFAEKQRQFVALGVVGYALPRTRQEYVFSNFVSITAGIVEELVYRGYVIWLLSLYMPLWAAAIVSTIAFGVAHAYQGWEGILKTGFVGGIFATIYLATGSIWIPVVLHALLDMLQMAMVRELHIDRSVED
ncbi:MAG: CPBP family intramembrane metalloprotease [Pseudomonadales bacterium]|nr:CPBP family intramembrane metalloprotease [Pseudomonadales bacterium]